MGFFVVLYVCFVSTIASDWLERLVPEMKYYLSNGTLNSTR